MARYAEPWRKYHNESHLLHCLGEFDRARAVAEQPDEVEAALWFHDAIYQPGRDDNEAESAGLAEAALPVATAGAARARIRSLIMVTRHQATARDRDAQLTADIDLAVLGADARQFGAYELAIRQEYSSVPDLQFRLGRMAVLRRFLDRPRIYQTEVFYGRYEAAARLNLTRSISAMEAAG